jgi:hypothetical protein
VRDQAPIILLTEAEPEISKMRVRSRLMRSRRWLQAPLNNDVFFPFIFRGRWTLVRLKSMTP